MRGSNPTPWRVPAVITAAMLTLVLAACGGDSNDDSGSTSAGSQTVASLPECSTESFQSPAAKDVTGTVKTILEQVPDLDAVKAMIPEFEKEYPGVKVEIEEASYDVIRDKQIASFQSDDGSYNVIPVDTGWVPEYTSAGFIEDLGPGISCLGEEYDYDDFAPALREIGQADGQVTGVPYYSYATGFVYRDDLWDAAPNTLDELVTGAQDLTDSEHAGIALQPMQGLPILEEWYPYLLASGGTLWNEETGEWTVDTPEAKKALETYIELYETAAPKNSVNWGFDESTRAASSGKATSLSTYALLFQSLNDSDSAASGKFALAPFPGGRGTGGAWSWSIPENAADKDAAWAWISWITAKQQDKQRTIEGGAPVRDSAMADPEVWKKAGGEAYFNAYKEIVGKAIPICRGVGCAEASQLIGENLNSAVAGTQSIEEALATAQSDVDAASGL